MKPKLSRLHDLFGIDLDLDNDQLAVKVLEDCTARHIENVPLLVAAPMVRYAKLPFRLLTKKYSADLTYTPMIYADNFISSEQCRSIELTTCPDDNPVVVQFASNNPDEFAQAAIVVSRYFAGVDLNCGCPQRDVIKQGFGSKLLSDPTWIATMIATTRRRLDTTDYPVSIKIRIKDDLKESVELCRQAESAGASFITVHGRTPSQRSEAANYEAIKLMKSTVSIPVIANGGVKSYEQVLEVAKFTGVDGVMVADGLLDNPAMFAGHVATTVECTKDWVRLCVELGHPFELFHHQLMFMLRSLFNSRQRTAFNNLTGYPAVLDFLNDHVFQHMFTA